MSPTPDDEPSLDEHLRGLEELDPQPKRQVRQAIEQDELQASKVARLAPALASHVLILSDDDPMLALRLLLAAEELIARA